MITYLKKIGKYIIDLKYLNKHLFSKKKCFSCICKSTENKYRIPLVDQKVIASNKTKHAFKSSHVVGAKVGFPTNDNNTFIIRLSTQINTQKELTKPHFFRQT